METNICSRNWLRKYFANERCLRYDASFVVITQPPRKVLTVVEFPEFIEGSIETTVNDEWVSQYFKKIVRECGMNDRIYFHSLRHSFASNLVQRCASIYVIKELLGHSDIQTTQIYSHLQKDNLVNVVSLLDL